VGHEGLGRRAPRDRVEDGRLHLDEGLRVEVPADGRDGGEADLEDPPGLLVDDQVDVAAAEAGVDVGQAVPLVGQGRRLFDSSRKLPTLTESSPRRVS